MTGKTHRILCLVLCLAFLPFPLISVQAETGCLIPDSDVRPLTLQELLEWDAEALGYIRNEIFARHGCRFPRSGKYDNYFRAQSWYQPNKNEDNAVACYPFLSELEWSNANLVASVLDLVTLQSASHQPEKTWQDRVSGLTGDKTPGNFHPFINIGDQMPPLLSAPEEDAPLLKEDKNNPPSGPAYFAGWEKGYMLMLLEMTDGTARIGYHVITGTTDDTLCFEYQPAVVLKDAVATSDPYGYSSDLRQLSAGTAVTYLTTFYGTIAWDYLEITFGGKRTRCLIPAGSLQIEGSDRKEERSPDPSIAPTAEPTAVPTAVPTAAPTAVPAIDEGMALGGEILYSNDIPPIRLFARNSVLHIREENQQLDLTVYLDPSITGTVTICQEDGVQLCRTQHNGSGRLSISLLMYSEEEKELDIYAEADGIRSAPITCSFEAPVTREMVDTMIALGQDMLTHLDSLGLGGDYSEEALRQAEAFLRSDPRVGHVEWGVGDHGPVLFYLTTDDLVSVYGDMTPSPDAAGYSDGNTELAGYIRQETLSAPNLVFDTESVMTNSNIASLVFDPEDEYNQMTKMAVFCKEKLGLTAKSLHSDYREYTGTGALNALGEEVLGDNGLLVLAGHGLELSSFPYGKDGIVCIRIGTSLPDDVQGLKTRISKRSPFHASDCRLIHFIEMGENFKFVSSYYITPKYLNEKLGDRVFDNTLVFLFVCHGFGESSLPMAFLSRGAAAVIGHSSIFQTFYAMTLLNALANRMQEMNSISPQVFLQQLWDNWDRADAEQRFLDDIMTTMEDSFTDIFMGSEDEQNESAQSFSREKVFDHWLEYIRGTTKQVYDDNSFASFQENGNFHLSGSGIISGRVYQKPETSDPPVPYANAGISVYRWLNHAFSPVFQTSTDQKGHYVTEMLPAGLYFICAQPIPPADEHREMDVCRVELNEWTVTAQDLYLPATARLTIEVRDESSGSVLPGCDLTLISKDPAAMPPGENSIAGGQTDRRGQWTQEVNKGTYLLVVQRDGYEKKTVEISVLGPEANCRPDPVTLRPIPEIGSLAVAMDYAYLSSDGSDFYYDVYVMDENKKCMLTEDGLMTLASVLGSNIDQVRFRVYLHGKSGIFLEHAESMTSGVKENATLCFALYQLNSKRELVKVKEARMNGDTFDSQTRTMYYDDNVYLFKNGELIDTVPYGEALWPRLESLFGEDGIHFGASYTLHGLPTRNVSPSFSYRLAQDTAGKLVYDSDDPQNRAALYSTKEIREQFYAPADMRSENGMGRDQREKLDRLVLDISSILGTLTLTRTTQNGDGGFTEAYKVGELYAVEIGVNKDGGIRSVYLNDSGYIFEVLTVMSDRRMEPTDSMQAFYEAVISSSALDLTKQQRDELMAYDYNAAATERVEFSLFTDGGDVRKESHADIGPVQVSYYKYRDTMAGDWVTSTLTLRVAP